MKLLFLADLHHDFWREDGRNPFAGIEDKIADLDLLVLAGDISNKPKVRWKTAFADLTRMLPAERIKVFPGNHDFYQFRLDGENRLRDFATNAGVGYVNMSEILLGDLRLLCATLWTDLAIGPGRLINEEFIPTRMNDYKLIRVASGGFRPMQPRDVIQHHLAHRNWLADRLSTPFDGRTIVVTHHAPHPGVLHSYTDGLDAAYASDLEELILEYQPDEWLFGHCHDAHDITIGTTRLRNISLGYPDDVANPADRIKGLIRSF